MGCACMLRMLRPRALFGFTSPPPPPPPPPPPVPPPPRPAPPSLRRVLARTSRRRRLSPRPSIRVVVRARAARGFQARALFFSNAHPRSTSPAGGRERGKEGEDLAHV